MIDPAQTALFFVIIVLTILLLVLGVQVFFILRGLRQTIDKANKVLDDTGYMELPALYKLWLDCPGLALKLSTLAALI